MLQQKLHLSQNLPLKWQEISLDMIIGGKTPDNIPYLKLFLQDYKKEFNVEVVNAACQKCIYTYHNDFIKKYNPMETNSKYKLLAKREGLQLDFGSSHFITNANLTDSVAKQLVKKFKELNPAFKMEDLFEVYPKEEVSQPAPKAKKAK